MRNRYPVWKNLLILTVLAFGIIYSLPNFYGEDPSVQLSPSRNAKIDESLVNQIDKLLGDNGVKAKASELTDKRVLVRFNDTDSQIKAEELLKTNMGDKYSVALNLAPATPGWLRAINAKPMYLGLDLRGGVHFMLQVDMDAAVTQAQDRFAEDIRTDLRESKIRYLSVEREKSSILVKFQDAQTLAQGHNVIKKEIRGLVLNVLDNELTIVATIAEPQIREIRKLAVAQNITILRNRVNELGVAEPVIQQQGEDRIVVQLPGVQDTARAKEILGATATLEFRLVDSEHVIGPFRCATLQ